MVIGKAIFRIPKTEFFDVGTPTLFVTLYFVMIYHPIFAIDVLFAPVTRSLKPRNVPPRERVMIDRSGPEDRFASCGEESPNSHGQQAG